MSKITFTAIPAGREVIGDKIKYRLNVLVSPKLDPGAVPDVLKEWPNHCRDLRFNVRVAKIDGATKKIKSKPETVAVAQLTRQEELDPKLYGSLFGDAQSKGFDDIQKRVDKNTTFKTYESKAVSNCINTVMSKFLKANLQLSARADAKNSLSDIDKLVTEHAPFPTAPAEKKLPTEPTLVQPSPAGVGAIASLKISDVISAMKIRRTGEPAPTAQPPLPVNLGLETNAQETQKSYRDLIERILNTPLRMATHHAVLPAPEMTVDEQASLKTATPAAVLPAPEMTLDERASLTRRIHLRDAFRIQNGLINNLVDEKTNLAQSLSEAAFSNLTSVATRQTTGKKVEPLQNPLLDLLSFWQRTHRRADSIKHDHLTPSQDLPDFHERWSLLGNYSALFDRLGMVLHLEWTATTDDQLVNSSQAISVTPENASALPGVEPVPVWVSYESDVFRPRSSDGSIRTGYLALSPDKYHLETCDLDGGGQKLAQYIISLGLKKLQDPQAIEKIAATNPDDLVPPPCRTAGLSIISKDRQDDIQRSFTKAKGFAPAEDVLYAEDLVRGYVIDLWAAAPDSQNGQWYSLCRRKESFALLARDCESPDAMKFRREALSEPFLTRIAEGSVKPVTLEFNEKPEGQTPLPEKYVLQSLADWRGDLLCVELPEYGTVRKVGNDVSLKCPWKLVAKMDLPVTQGKCELQPPLRVGANYRMAVRVELLTGDVVAFSQSPPSMLPDSSQPPLILKRYEPISAPVVLDQCICDSEPQKGNSEPQKGVHDLVLQSTSAESLTWSTVTRLIAPPRVDERVARLHINKSRCEELTSGFRRLKLKYEDGSLLPVPARIFDDDPQVPYLPDPLADEITFWLDDHVEGKRHGPIRVPLSHPSRAIWPNLLVHLLQFKAAEGAQSTVEVGAATFAFEPGLSYDSKIVTVRLPAAHFATLTAQCGFGPTGKNNLDNMASWDLVNSESSGYEEAMLRGDCSMICSPVRLTLTHAVQLPGKDVRINYQSQRAFQSTGTVPQTTRNLPDQIIVRDNEKSLVQVEHTLEFDRKSTGKIRVNVRWSECRDNGDGHLSVATGSAIALDELIADSVEKGNEEEDSKSSVLQFDPSHTKYCKLIVHATAISRFRSHFPDDTEEACSRTGRAQHVELLSSARPDPPDPLYVVPTFRWDDNGHAEETTFSNRRHSAGLRIYLGGRWFSSGDDELLGIVVSQASDVVAILQDPQKRHRVPLYNPIKESPEEQFVSSWGGDPIFAAQPSIDQLYLTNWHVSNCPPCEAASSNSSPNQRLETEVGGACGWNLSVPGVEGTLVAVVGYKPCFDEARKLWYCDVTFSQAPRYGVFVRLVLARYQPHAKAGFELSSTVTSGFSQLNPDRTLIVRPKRIQAQQSEEDGISITIWGIPNPGSSVGENEFEVYLERRTYAGTESLGWEREMVVAKAWAENKRGSDSIAFGEQVIWYGEAIPHSCAQRRIVVLEFERYESDGENGVITSRRLVYADAVEIN